ncbi:hypothetical protein F4824DRAFT_441377, partial [Ustulina deusta]
KKKITVENEFGHLDILINSAGVNGQIHVVFVAPGYPASNFTTNRGRKTPSEGATEDIGAEMIGKLHARELREYGRQTTSLEPDKLLVVSID